MADRLKDACDAVSGYPGGSFRPPMRPQPKAQQKRLETSPQASLIQWLRAFPNPAYDPKTKKAPEWDDEYLRRDVPGPHRVILQSERVMPRYFAHGTWETGSIAVAYDPARTPFAPFDHVLELSSAVQTGATPCSADTPAPVVGGIPYPGARVLVHKATLIRGESRQELTGRISASGVNITGTDTEFTTELRRGDVFFGPNNFAARVVTVTDDTHLVLSAAAPAPWAGVPAERGRERLTYRPAARLLSVEDSDREYILGLDVELSEDGETLRWLSPTHAPAPGAGFGVIWEYFPTYVITELGQHSVVVNGVPGLSVVAASLWKPENLRR